MKCVEYNKSDDIFVEFQDKYKYIVKSQWRHFDNGSIKNPYFPEVLGVGIVGVKYPTKVKEYSAWRHILERCFDKKLKEKCPTYINATCCNEWLLYENFYEWLHKQPNFDKWLTEKRWAIDKDILYKGNKVYSPETCCLVPQNINSLFTKRDCDRGSLPIGVQKHQQKYRACLTALKQHIALPVRDTINEAFLDYKECKESIIKQVAQTEFYNGNITKRCYDAMMKYEVEITD